MNIGKNIAELRKTAGITQEELASQIGVSAQAVSKWETEVSMPDIMLMPVIAGVFGITIDELYGGKANADTKVQANFDTLPEVLYDQIIRQVSCVFAGEHSPKEASKMKQYLEENEDAKSVACSDTGGAVLINNNFAVVFRSVKGCEYLKDEKLTPVLGRVFEVLSNEWVRKILAYEIEHRTEYLTPSYASKKLGLGLEESRRVLDELVELHLNYVTEVREDENSTIRIYSLDNSDMLLCMIIAVNIAKLIAENRSHYFNYRGAMYSNWLK